MPLTDLRKIALLRSLSPRELKRVHAITRTREYPAGAMIIQKHEAALDMFLVLSGRIKIFSYSSARKRKTFAYLGPGDFFGELAVIVGRMRSASAQAVETSRVLIVPKAELKRLLLSDADLCFGVLKSVSARLMRATEEIESLLFRNVLGRVAKTLQDLGKSCGREGKDGLLLEQRYTHQELADLVGTTREPLSRALAMLRRADLVDASRGRILIRDPEKLAGLIDTSLQQG